MQACSFCQLGRNPRQDIQPFAASPPGSSSSEQGEVEIRGRLGRVSLLGEEVVSQCPVCYYELGCRTLCTHMRHSVCESCYDRLRRHRWKVSCTLCRASGLSKFFLQAQDATLRRMRQKARVTCTDCNNWCGPVDKISEHIKACNLRDYSCPNAIYGCDWKGPQSQMEAHEQRCTRAGICASQRRRPELGAQPAREAAVLAGDFNVEDRADQLEDLVERFLPGHWERREYLIGLWGREVVAGVGLVMWLIIFYAIYYAVSVFWQSLLAYED